MSEEIADFAKRHKGKRFPSGASEPTDEKKSGDLSGYNLGSRDPESDKLAKKHLRHVTGNRAGNKEHVFKGGTKDSLDDEKNKRLKGHGRNEKGDPVYEGCHCPVCGAENCSKHSEHKKGKKLLVDKSKLKENTLSNEIALDYLANRLEERNVISGLFSAGTAKPDYTGGMEVNKTPDAEVQTDGKPADSKSSKTKKSKFGSEKKIKEESELNELSQGAKDRYKVSAGRDAYSKEGELHYHQHENQDSGKLEKGLANRRAGMRRASVKEEDELNEISAWGAAGPTTKDKHGKSVDNYYTKASQSTEPRHQAAFKLLRQKMMTMGGTNVETSKAKVPTTEAGKKKIN